MRLRIIRNVKNILNDPKAAKAFVHFVEMRQRLFEAQYSKALCLDRYDLIADHVLIYEDSGFEQPIAYVRSIAADTCAEYDIPLPILQSISHSPVHLEAYQRFEKEVPLPVHMGFLCLDQRFKQALRGVKLVDLLTWVGFIATGPRPEKMGLCATLNAKFNQNAWLESVGEAVGGLPLLKHPIIPDPHDLLLIPKIRPSYWKEQHLKFGMYMEDAEWLVPGDLSEQRKAA